ncbi:MAG: hypothetical protein F9K37_11250 [Bacteroidales bacterium]|nr:MAG: hypothetical protein F9K37_11250 [Bacteroidales bacterium]
MTRIDFLQPQSIIKPDFVLVCGVYKTGTSLITHILEEDGYYNPAILNNKLEHGNGLSQKYMTRECQRTRNINREIISLSKNTHFFKLESEISMKATLTKLNINFIKHFLLELPPNSILKDPQFTYTLYYWIEAIAELNKSVKVCFTNRTVADSIMAWNEAYFTKTLLAKNRLALNNMLLMQKLQENICFRKNIPFETFYFPKREY